MGGGFLWDHRANTQDIRTTVSEFEEDIGTITLHAYDITVGTYVKSAVNVAKNNLQNNIERWVGGCYFW